jgi:hypothetical protein
MLLQNVGACLLKSIVSHFIVSCLPYTMEQYQNIKFITFHTRQTTGIPKKTVHVTSFRNTVNTKTRIAVTRKARQFPRISTYLMMAEWADHWK